MPHAQNQRRMWPVTSGRSAFTLVEMLVVIAIIVILLSLIQPGLLKARGVAQQVACANDLRQIYLGIAGYNSDNSLKNRLPIHWDHARHLNWVRRILPYVNDTASRYNCWDQGSINTWCHADAASQARTVWRANKLFVCPSNNRTRPGVPWGLWVDTYWVSYAANLQAFWGTMTSVWPLEGEPQWKPHAEFGQTEFAIIMEGNTAVNSGDFQSGYYFSNQHQPLPPGWGNGNGPVFSMFGKMHNEINNFLIDDGRVAARKFEIVPTGNYWDTANALTPILNNPDW